MLLEGVKSSPIMNEFSPEEREKYFGVTQKKVIHNIDTLYYVAYLREFENASGVQTMIARLREMREAYDPKEGCEFLGMQYVPRNFKNIYRHCFVVDGCFDIFVAETIPNMYTPRFLIMLKSIDLWVTGVKGSIEKSFLYLMKLVDEFQLPFDCLGENRIDYAFHTNAIQNSKKFFTDKKLLKSLKSRMTTYQKVGKIGSDISIEYLSLGKRQSNNVFFRIYNKTREVVEKGYKAVFIRKWRDNRLISDYDMFVLETAYRYKSFASGVAIGKIDWYVKFGRSDDCKRKLMELREKYLINSENAAGLNVQLDKIMPPITQVTNIEFQTMRKFYYSMRKAIEGFDCSVDDTSPFYRLYRLIENRKSILDYLTSKTVSFKKDRNDKESDYLSFWKRVRSCKIDNIGNADVYRTYQKGADVTRLINDIANKVGSVSVIKGHLDTAFHEDVSDLLGHFNDNDLHGFIAYDGNGELVEDLHFTGDYGYYDVIKAKKERQYKYLVDKEKTSPPEEV